MADRGQVGRRVVEPPVALAHEERQRLVVPTRESLQEHGRGALALHGHSCGLQVRDHALEVRIVEGLAALVQLSDIESIVYFLVLDARRRTQRFPGGQGLDVSGLEPDHALPRPNLKVLVGIEPLLRGLVQRHKIAQIHVPGSLRVERLRKFVPQVFHEHAELRPPVANVVESEDIMSHEGQEVGEGVADDGGAEVTHMHFLGDVGGGKVHDNFLLVAGQRNAQSAPLIPRHLPQSSTQISLPKL
mmetsp:Transcript_27168/g.65295  ORF Transcript_27168/g.65295 Transcript_27168/m.65295 type:complete len:245 (+) Transcript_27168:78-812(+)